MRVRLLMIVVVALLLSVVWVVRWQARGYDDTDQLYLELGATGVAASIAAGFWAARRTK